MRNRTSVNRSIDQNATDIVSDDANDSDCSDDYNDRYSQPVHDDDDDDENDPMRAYYDYNNANRADSLADIEQNHFRVGITREAYIPKAVGGSAIEAMVAPAVFEFGNRKAGGEEDPNEAWDVIKHTTESTSLFFNKNKIVSLVSHSFIFFLDAPFALKSAASDVHQDQKIP